MTHSKPIQRCTQVFLGIYLLILGFLAVHPFVGEELHHHEHVCEADTHYHKDEVDCPVCLFAFSLAEYSEPYNLDTPIARELTIYYARLAVVPTTSTPYHPLQRGPPTI